MAISAQALDHPGGVFAYSGTAAGVGTGGTVATFASVLNAVPFDFFAAGGSFTASISNTSNASGSYAVSVGPRFGIDTAMSVSSMDTNYGKYVGVNGTITNTATASVSSVVWFGTEISRISGPAGPYMQPVIYITAPNASCTVSVTFDGAVWWRK